MATFQPTEPRPVEALGLDTGQAQWLGGSVDEMQAQEAARAGLRLGASSDRLVLTPGAVATADALRRFRRASERVEGDAIARLPPALQRWSEEPALGEPARLLRLRGGGGLDEARVQAATPVDLAPTIREVEVPLAAPGGGARRALALSDSIVISTQHWSGLLWANLLGLGPALWRELAGPTWLSPLRLTWAALRALSLNRHRVAAAASRVPRSARVHPSAVVEASVLGPETQVGPHAVVRGAWLGAGARVEAHGLVEASVLGAGAVVQRYGWARFAVLHPGAAHGGAMQLSVIGPDASSKGGSYLMDQNLGASVRLRRDGVLHPAPLGVAGVGLGARSVVASGVWVAAGRSVPPDRALVPDRGVWSGAGEDPGVRELPLDPASEPS